MLEIAYSSVISLFSEKIIDTAVKYRADIDGLRALAVLFVVLFHFGLGFPGGFVGVDVFFAISGYLIGGHIYQSKLEDDFSWGQFYVRRIKRILPALIAVVVAVWLVMFFVSTPEDFRTLGRDAAAALLSVSNVTLWNSLNYFSPSTEHNPLLMTWSLGGGGGTVLFSCASSASCRDPV
ncbi:acyltransferase family protein [Trabulsiella odontotermitis]|uniref:acyltransferase family protein n=1 Tax=Trabulsiella odontotermitis TaxID=379893 RepID=UPI0009BD8B59